MTVLEMFEHMKRLVENGHGSDEFIVSVRDSFKTHGCDAKPFNSQQFMCNGYGQTRLVTYLEKDLNNKQPNITFRK